MAEAPEGVRGPAGTTKSAALATPRRRFHSWQWFGCLPLLVAGVELLSYTRSQGAVVGDDAWRQAGEVVRREFRPRDVVVSAPAWTDPLMRRELGDRLSVSAAAPNDRAPFERLWGLTIRGATIDDEPDTTPELDLQVGPIRIRRWPLGPSPIRFDFVSELRNATVTQIIDGIERPCPWRATGFPDPGGINQGPMTPAARHVCPGPPWLWVGQTVMEDLALQLHACVWQHPAGSEPVRSTFRDVLLGERLVLYGGLYYGHENRMTGGPVTVAVSVDGRTVGRLVHRDGDGFKRLEVATRDLEQAQADPDRRGTVMFDVTADAPEFRTLCWAATTRAGRDRED